MTAFRLSASLLSADFARLGADVRAAEDAGCDEVHFDVMDGRFVPNLTMGLPVLESIRPHTGLPIDVHMMVHEPGRFTEDFAKAGADVYTVHVEACRDVHAALDKARSAGMRPAVAINPGTALAAIGELLPFVDRVLVMTVNPGLAGQRFIEGVLPKIERLRRLIGDRRLTVEVAVDGGIKPDTARQSAQAGAQTLISGSGIFGHPDGIAGGISAMRKALQNPAWRPESDRPTEQ